MFQAAFNMCINFIYSSIGPIFWRSIYFTTNFIMSGLDKYQSMKESGTFWVSFCFISSGLINLAHNLRTLFLYIFFLCSKYRGPDGFVYRCQCADYDGVCRNLMSYVYIYCQTTRLQKRKFSARHWSLIEEVFWFIRQTLWNRKEVQNINENASLIKFYFQYTCPTQQVMITKKTV